MSTNVITRFAPSPTGYLHVGGARTALYNWLYARKNNGKFILRIEDTDLERSTDDSTSSILRSLEWLGINWDAGPYYQSDRIKIYHEKMQILIEKGFIYPAFETKEELEAMRQKAISAKKNPIYDRSALKLSKDEIEHKINSGIPFVWRFKVPDEGFTEIPELLIGGEETKLKNDSIGDFVITRPGTKNTPGMPLYNFVCAVDDADMQITHVIRGVEHFTNASRQVLLMKALGNQLPQYLHLPIIMKNNKKMSKRDVDLDGKFPVSVMERAKIGYLPEATLNHLVLLGWSHPEGKEIMELEEMVAHFSLERLNKSNPNFDEKKYLYFNTVYISGKTNFELYNLIRPYFIEKGYDLTKFDQKTLEQMVSIEKTRCKVLSDFSGALDYFFINATDLQYEEKGIQKNFLRKDIDVIAILEATQNAIQSIQSFNRDTIDQILSDLLQSMQLEYKIAGPIIRLALTGRTQSPGLSEIMEILGALESSQRIENAKKFISEYKI